MGQTRGGRAVRANGRELPGAAPHHAHGAELPGGQRRGQGVDHQPAHLAGQAAERPHGQSDQREEQPQQAQRTLDIHEAQLVKREDREEEARRRRR